MFLGFLNMVWFDWVWVKKEEALLDRKVRRKKVDSFIFEGIINFHSL